MTSFKQFFFLLVLLFSNQVFSAPIDNHSNALMHAAKARALMGHQNTTIPPGDQTDHLRARRGGPHLSHHKEAECGGVSIGNVRPVAGDHRKHNTTIIIQGHILNTGNRC